MKEDLNEALLTAVSAKQVPVVKELLAKGAKPNFAVHGRPSVIHAIWLKSAPLAHALVDGGADANAVDKEQSTALHWLAHRLGDLKLAKRLIDAGADVNAKDKGLLEGTPLHYALQRKSRDYAELLVEHGADIEARTGYHDMTPLLLMCESQSGDIAAHEVEHAKWLLELGAKTDVVTSSGTDAFSLAASRNGAAMIALLVSKKVKSRPDGRGNSPLHLCWNWNDRPAKSSLWKLLLKASDVNAKNKDGSTPLIEAVTRGSKEGVKFLLANKADPSIADKEGKTAVDYANESSDKKLAALFTKRKA